LHFSRRCSVILNSRAKMTGKVKPILVTGRGSRQHCETSRHPHFFRQSISDCGKVVSVTCWPHLILSRSIDMQLFIFFLFFHYMFRLHATTWRWLHLWTYLILNVNLSSLAIVLGSTQPATQMRTRNLSGSKARPARKADNLPPCVNQFSRKFRILVVSQPCGSPCPVAKIDLPLYQSGPVWRQIMENYFAPKMHLL
jgi:hypothetical protein